jgi:chemotaxis protein MotA
MVLGGTIGALLFAGAIIPSMLKALFSSELGEEVKHQAIRGWKLAAGFSLAIGASATLIGLVLMLANMDDPAAIGPGFAIANLTSLYALIIALAISFPMYKSLERSS